jgi:hypothetical protein
MIDFLIFLIEFGLKFFEDLDGNELFLESFVKLLNHDMNIMRVVNNIMNFNHRWSCINISVQV